MHRTPPPQRDRPAPLAPKRPAGRPNNAEKTPCPTRARETGRSISQSEDTQTKSIGKQGAAVAGTPIPPPRATSVIALTPPNNSTEQHDDGETSIPETPLQHIEQIIEGNKTHLEELLKLFETTRENLNKVNYRQINIIIEIIKVFVKKITIIIQRMIIENKFENRFNKIEIKLNEIQKTISESQNIYKNNSTINE